LTRGAARRGPIVLVALLPVLVFLALAAPVQASAQASAVNETLVEDASATESETPVCDTADCATSDPVADTGSESGATDPAATEPVPDPATDSGGTVPESPVDSSPPPTDVVPPGPLPSTEPVAPVEEVPSATPPPAEPDGGVVDPMTPIAPGVPTEPVSSDPTAGADTGGLDPGPVPVDLPEQPQVLVPFEQLDQISHTPDLLELIAAEDRETSLGSPLPARASRSSVPVRGFTREEGRSDPASAGDAPAAPVPLAPTAPAPSSPAGASAFSGGGSGGFLFGFAALAAAWSLGAATGLTRRLIPLVAPGRPVALVSPHERPG
jgi:hypothetical protein